MLNNPKVQEKYYVLRSSLVSEVQISGRRATKRIELDRGNIARLLASKEICRLYWQRHNEIRNKITIAEACEK